MSGPNSLLYTSKIRKINFSVMGDSDVRQVSSAVIKTHNLFKNSKPYEGGVYDAHLGTTESNYECATCGHKKKFCLGHSGHIELNYPVLSPLYINDIKKWLKLICFKCGLPIIESKEFKKFNKKKRLMEATKSAKSNKKKECVHCKEPHPSVEFDKNDLLFTAFYKNESGQDIEVKKLYPHVIREIFGRISDTTVVLLGKHPISHPKKFILGAIYVPGAPVRPDTKVINGGRSKNDDLTTLLQNIIKENDKIPPIMGSQYTIESETEKHILAVGVYYYTFVKGAPGKKLVTGSSGQLMSISARLKGKTGRFRRNQMGKRVVLCGRSVISGDPTLKLNEFGISLKAAQTLYVEEVVQPCNHKRLMTFFMNGSKQYPGAKKVIKARTGAEKLVDKLLEKGENLEIGDIIRRNLVTGDYASFNRQPSLSPSQIAAHKIVVYEDPSILTFRLNPLGLVLYHGDFDGDEMNLYISTSIITRNEISQMTSVPNWLISFSKSAPLMGQIDDSIIGSFECTRSGIEIDKYHAMLMFSGCTYLPDFIRAKYSGRDVMSLALNNTPITYSKTPNFYNQNYAPMLNYDPTEIKVEIIRGQIKSGVLDKAIIGKEKPNSIYHVIASEYGNEMALDVMFNMQQLAINFNLLRGFSVGMNDIILDKGTLAKVHEIESTIIKKANLITEKLQRGEIIPPIDQTVSDFYEEQQINELRVMEDFHEPVLSSISPNNNALLKLILSGSKGTINNLLQMESNIGQATINGERSRQTFSYKRTLPYFRRFETTPESRGYITNSYMAGLNAPEFMAAAMAARFDFISKALLTSVTGEQERKSVKNLESIIINNYYMAVKGRNIIQPIYGEDGIDSRKVAGAKFDTVSMPKAAFEAKYKNPGKDPIFGAEFERLAADRAKYREIFLGIEEGFFKELFSDTKFVAVDASKALHMICVELEAIAREPTEPELVQMVKMAQEFIDDVPYFYLNDRAHARRAKIPEHIASAALLTQIHMRISLCSMALKKEKCTPKILEVVLAAIKVKYKLAIIEYGTAAGIIAAMSFCAPLTQYMLDSVHSAQRGGTNKSEMVHTKEVMSARATSDLQNPMMVITLKPEFERDEKKVQAIANSIEYMVLSQFVSVARIFYEKFNEPIHPDFIEEKENVIGQFLGLNPLLTPPGDLTRWCIHFTLNKTTMILKNMNLELIIKRLREKFQNTYIVYSQENSPKIVIRMYIRGAHFTNVSHVNEENIKSLKDEVLNCKIRGIEKIKQARPVKLLRNKVTPEGEITRDTNRWGIQTIGINMMGVMCHPAVDPYKVQTNSVEEIHKLLGVEAARAKLLMEIKDLGEGGLNLHHSSMFADEMSFTGKITAIEKGGVGVREPENMLLRIGFSSPIQSLEDAGVNSVSSTVSGLTAKLLVGSMPESGTTYNTFTINESFVKSNTKSAEGWLE